MIKLVLSKAKYLLFLTMFMCSCGMRLAYAQDQLVNARNASVQMTNQNGPSGTVPWSTLSNQTYLLTGQTPDSAFCVSIVNNNTTSAHSFSINVFQTGDSQVVDYSHNTGRYTPIAVIGTPSPVAASTTTYFYVHSNAASKVAFQFTGASTQAGSPDTVDIYAVQTTSQTCGPVNARTGQGYTLSTSDTGTSAAPPIMSISDGLGQALAVSNFVTNPTSLQILANVFSPTGINKKAYFDKVVLSSSVAVEIRVNITTNTGSGCSNNSPVAINTGSTYAPGFMTSNINCSGPPPVGVSLADVFLPANGYIVVDLKGAISGAGSNAGIDIIVQTGVTGNVTSILYWYEK